jgi:hypothetical protein
MSTFNNFNTVDKIAERFGVYACVTTESGRQVIELHGRAQDIRKVLLNIEGYHVRWEWDDVGAPMPDGEQETIFSLYSGRTNWAKLGY